MGEILNTVPKGVKICGGNDADANAYDDNANTIC